MRIMGEKISKKFDIAQKALSAISDMGIAEWTKPKGGYFISLDMKLGSAQRVFELMKGAGVTLTQVGATFPYGRDPEDSNLRIAPSFPEMSELKLATKILCTCTKIAAAEKLLAEME